MAVSLLSADVKLDLHFNSIGTPVGKEFKSAAHAEPNDQADTEDLSETALKHQQHSPEWHARNQRSLSMLFTRIICTSAADCSFHLRAEIQDIVNKTELHLIAPPRKGKKLLVLDLDYTLLDCKKWTDPSVSMIDFARPGLDL